MRINTSDKAIIMVDGHVDFVYLRAMLGEEKIMHSQLKPPPPSLGPGLGIKGKMTLF